MDRARKALFAQVNALDMSVAIRAERDKYLKFYHNVKFRETCFPKFVPHRKTDAKSGATNAIEGAVYTCTIMRTIPCTICIELI
jgi:hypothetical protein